MSLTFTRRLAGAKLSSRWRMRGMLDVSLPQS
jgi:hypothetical protein